MTGEEFIKVWGNLNLRQYVIDQAKRHSQRIENQEDFVQEAWMAISEACYDNTDVYLKNIALNAIRRIYRKYKIVSKKELKTWYSNSVEQ